MQLMIQIKTESTGSNPSWVNQTCKAQTAGPGRPLRLTMGR